MLAFEDFARVKILCRDFIRNISRRARTNLTQGDRNVSKGLYRSLKGEQIVNENVIEVNFTYSDYGDYQDQGIKGWKSSMKAPQSPFKYKKKLANFKAIRGWVGARRFQFRNKKTGVFMSYDSTAFLIARSIAAKGIEATRWFSEAVDKYLPTFMNDFLDKYAMDLEDFETNKLNN